MCPYLNQTNPCLNCACQYMCPYTTGMNGMNRMNGMMEEPEMDYFRGDLDDLDNMDNMNDMDESESVNGNADEVFAPNPPFINNPPMMPGQPNMPPGPPPNKEPMKGPSLKAVDPGAIKNCKYRYVYIWPRGGRGFWAYLTYVGRDSIAGYSWNGRRWVYFGMDLRRIESFQCY